MKKTIKVLAIVMAVIMLIGILPTGVFALSEEKAVKSLAILKNDFVYYENDRTQGDWIEVGDSVVFGYDAYQSFYELDIEITYTDNSTEVFNYNEYLESEEFYEEIPDITEEYIDYMPWEVGDEDAHYVVTYKGKNVIVPVTVVPSPVKSIEILENTYDFIEGDESVIAGLTEDDEYIYNAAYAVLYGLKLKITYNNGKYPVIYHPNYDQVDFEEIISDDPDELSQNLIELLESLVTIDGHAYYVDIEDQLENPWTVGGDNSYEFSYMGYSIDVPANLIETYVESIEVLENPYKYTKESKNEGYWDIDFVNEDPVFIYREDISLSGLKVKINYKDGESEIYNVRENSFLPVLNEHEFFVYSYQYEDKWVTGDDNSYILQYAGVETEVKATVVDPEGIDASKKFKDVNDSKWYIDYVNYAVNYGLFNGTSDNTFDPDLSMNRAMFVQVLANLAGAKTDEKADTGFKDVPKSRWYTGAVDWAAENKIVNGMGDGKFEPNANVTREQMCTMIVRFADYMSMNLFEINDKEVFTDDKQIASYAKEAVYACQMSGLVNGMGDGTFAPKGNATRAQVAKILSVFHAGYFSAA